MGKKMPGVKLPVKNKKVNNQFFVVKTGWACSTMLKNIVFFFFKYKAIKKANVTCVSCVTVLIIRWCNSCEMFIREYPFIFWSRMVSNHQINVED